MRIMIRLAALGMVAVSAILAAQAQTSASAAEQQLVAGVNRARRAQGLPGLRWDEALATAARRHAGLMAQHGAAEHGFAGEPSLASRVTQAGAHFVWLAENVIQGPGVEVIQEEFLKSANHRANILDSDMNSIGVGVVERGGQLFAVEDFSKAK
ncbi:MAG: CAP domain-containing protein [Candidatus Sulfotelmatobacter sp.]